MSESSMKAAFFPGFVLPKRAFVPTAVGVTATAASAATKVRHNAVYGKAGVGGANGKPRKAFLTGLLVTNAGSTARTLDLYDNNAADCSSADKRLALYAAATKTEFYGPFGEHGVPFEKGIYGVVAGDTVTVTPIGYEAP